GCCTTVPRSAALQKAAPRSRSATSMTNNASQLRCDTSPTLGSTQLPGTPRARLCRSTGHNAGDLRNEADARSSADARGRDRAERLGIPSLASDDTTWRRLPYVFRGKLGRGSCAVLRMGVWLPVQAGGVQCGIPFNIVHTQPR